MITISRGETPAPSTTNPTTETMKTEKPTNFVLHASEYKGEQKATFYLGKCALYGNGKRNAVEVTIELRTKDDGRLVFSASGNVWNQNHSDICRGGQCLDDPIFTERAKTNKLLAEILRFWNLYHLNDCNAGTPEQDECIAKMPADYFPEGETIDGFKVIDDIAAVQTNQRGLPDNPIRIIAIKYDEELH